MAEVRCARRFQKRSCRHRRAGHVVTPDSLRTAAAPVNVLESGI
jgi:hypothetical protein